MEEVCLKEDLLVTIEKLLEHFDNGGSFGDDPDVVLSIFTKLDTEPRLVIHLGK